MLTSMAINAIRLLNKHKDRELAYKLQILSDNYNPRPNERYSPVNSGY